MSGFLDLACGDAADADIHALDGPVLIDLDVLKVGEETTQRFPNDLRTRTAGPFDLTASFIFGPRIGTFFANDTLFGHVSYLLVYIILMEFVLN